MNTYIEQLSARCKDDPARLSLDEAAILYYSKLVATGQSNEFIEANLRRWLREQNPNKLSGPALGQWVDSVLEELRNGDERVSATGDANSVRSDNGEFRDVSRHDGVRAER